VRELEHVSGPSVSLCIPTWNGAAYLPEALASAIAQTFTDFELLIVDDASTDASVEIATACRDPRLRLLRNVRRLGIPGSWNRCLEEARGEYVKFLFQDDVLAPGALASLVTALADEPGAVLAFGRREIRHEGSGASLPLLGGIYGAALETFYASLPGSRPVLRGLDLVHGALEAGRDMAINVIGEPSFVLLRKDAARRAGGFDPSFAQLVDWELYLRLARRGSLVFRDELMGVFRVHPGAQSVANRRGLLLPREFVRLLARVEELYAADLPSGDDVRLRVALWRYRCHVLGEAVRGLLSPARGAGRP
jgi:glycosyltransferase involved in cell wall biosynthesis